MLMVRKTSTVSGKTYAYYVCSTHKAVKECSPHRIPAGKLEETVLFLLKQHISNVLELKKILSFIETVPFQQLDIRKLEERREKKEMEAERCAQLRTTLYEDMKDGMISKEDYRELHAAYEARRKNAQVAVRQIDMEIEKVLERKSGGFAWLDYFMEHRNIEKLDRFVAVSLIREIRVADKNNIEVRFDFSDCYQEILDGLASAGHDVSVDENGKLNIRVKEAV